MADEVMGVFFMPTRPVDGPGYYLKKNLMGGGMTKLSFS